MKTSFSFVFSVSFLLVFSLSCDLTRDSKPDTNDISITNTNVSEKVKNAQVINQDSTTGIRIVRSDSTYFLEFFDTTGSLVFEYDIWENNPFTLEAFEKYKEKPGHYPMRYKVPALTRNELKGKVPDMLIKNLNEDVQIGRLDVYIGLPNKLDHYKSFIPILYQLNAMEGYDEEYETPATFGIVKIISNDEKIFKEIEIINSGGRVAVSQDGRYLVSRIATKNEGGAFEVYDLRNERVVFSKKVGRDFELHGPALHTSNVIGLSANGLYSSIFTSFILVSDRETIFIKEFSGVLRNYTFEVIEEGIVLQHRTNKTIDTLFFNRDFQQIKI